MNRIEQKGLFQRAIHGCQSALLEGPQRGALLIRVKLNSFDLLGRLAVLWAMGSVALTLVVLLSVQLGFNFGAASFAFLIVIVFLSLLDSFVSSLFFSALAAGCLSFFFVEPRYTLAVRDTEHLIALAAFFLASLAVTGLVRRVHDLRMAEERTRNVGAQLRAVIDTIPVIVWSTLPNGENEFHNQRLLSYTGFSSDQAKGGGWVEMLHPDDADRHGRAWKTAVETGTPFECESRLKRSDGEYRWFLARAEPLRDERGNIVKWYGTNVDIDDRKQMEQALRRSEAYLTEAQKLSLTGSFGWNVPRGQIVWSDETFRIFGYEPTMTPSIERVEQRVHPDDLVLVRELLDRAANERRDFDCEHRLLMPDGSVKHLHVVARGAPSGAGDLEFMGAIMDVTAQKNAFAALEQSEQRYRDVFQHMPIGLAQIDSSRLVVLIKKLLTQGVTDLSSYIDAHPEFIWQAMDALIIEAANDYTVRMFGATEAAQMIGPTRRYWEANFDTARRMIEGRFRGERFHQEETKMMTIDGRVIDVLFAVARSGMLAEKSLVGFIDITERVNAQEMLNRVQADFAHAARVSMLGELTASIAHEVNQPLAAIALNGAAGLRWLSQPEPDLSELREMAESVVADARRAADIIARVRTMAAGQAPEQELVSLDHVIRETLLFLRHEVQTRAVSVSHHVGLATSRVRGDRTQLQQVIVNLAVNAMQAMTQAGCVDRRITIRTAMSDHSSLCCVVEDSGPGIRPEDLIRLFESFFTTKKGGMGMGLPICRSIIEAHGGRIAADNESIHGGARFSFWLPATPPDAPN